MSGKTSAVNTSTTAAKVNGMNTPVPPPRNLRRSATTFNIKSLAPGRVGDAGNMPINIDSEDSDDDSMSLPDLEPIVYRERESVYDATETDDDDDDDDDVVRLKNIERDYEKWKKDVSKRALATKSAAAERAVIDSIQGILADELKEVSMTDSGDERDGDGEEEEEDDATVLVVTDDEEEEAEDREVGDGDSDEEGTVRYVPDDDSDDDSDDDDLNGYTEIPTNDDDVTMRVKHQKTARGNSSFKIVTLAGGIGFSNRIIIAKAKAAPYTRCSRCGHRDRV